MKNMSKKEKVRLLKNIAFNEKPIDNDEKEELKNWKNITDDDIVDIPQDEKNKFAKEFRSAQKDFIKKQNKNDVLTIRIRHDIKEIIRKKAEEIGLNYQTYISMIIHQIATDKIVNETKVIV
jgi:predicted DNA binding CopG/RHH family protein